MTSHSLFLFTDGEGQLSTSHGALAYQLTGRRLFIETEMGQNVDCQLCVSAIDARGQELFTCIRLLKSGLETRCRKCDPTVRKFKVEIIPVNPVFSAWRPLIAAETAKPQGEVQTQSLMRTPAPGSRLLR